MSDAFSLEQRSQSRLAGLRRFLRTEAKMLEEELERAHAKGKKRLKLLKQKLEETSDRDLPTEAPAWKEELTAIRRGLSRLALSGTAAQKLKNEWNDWERHASFTDPADHDMRRERQEMIVSELRVRGLRLPAGAKAEVRPAAAPSVPAMPENEEPAAPVPNMRKETNGMEGEDEESESRETCLPYWERLIAGLDVENMDPSQVSRLLGAFRAMHGEQRSVDRQKGAHRFRLTAFESWH